MTSIGKKICNTVVVGHNITQPLTAKQMDLALSCDRLVFTGEEMKMELPVLPDYVIAAESGIEAYEVRVRDGVASFSPTNIVAWSVAKTEMRPNVLAVVAGDNKEADDVIWRVRNTGFFGRDLMSPASLIQVLQELNDDYQFDAQSRDFMDRLLRGDD